MLNSTWANTTFPIILFIHSSCGERMPLQHRSLVVAEHCCMLARARITGKWATGNNTQSSAENCADYFPSPIISLLSVQGPASHSPMCRSFVLSGSVLVGSVAGRKVIQECLLAFPAPGTENDMFYTFSFHFKYSSVPF